MGDGSQEPRERTSPGEPGSSGTLNLATYPTPRLLRILASLLHQIACANDSIRAEDHREHDQEGDGDSVVMEHETKEPSSKLFPPHATPPSPTLRSNSNLFSASAHSLSIPSSLLCFHARNVPSITIEAYLLRILKYCPTTNEVFLGLLVYFDRMSKIGHGKNRLPGNSSGSRKGNAEEQRGFAIDSFNVHRLVIAGVTVASKFFSDVFYTNSRYAKVGGLPHNELNQLELQFLLLNDFRLVIPLEEMQRYGDQLLAYWDGKEDEVEGEARASTKEEVIKSETGEPRPEKTSTREPTVRITEPEMTPKRPNPTPAPGPSTSASNLTNTRPQAPTPFHQLRAHQAAVSASAFNLSNTLLYTGDADGYTAITDLKTRRVVVHWKAHEGGVLGVEEWNGALVSHGRDNKLLIHEPFQLLQGPMANGPKPSIAPPRIAKTLDTNALNFCRFSLCSLGGDEALLAVPNTVDSEVADVYHLPSLRRLHAGLNAKPDPSGTFRPNAENGDAPRSGLIMSLQLHLSPKSPFYPRLAMGFEDGRVELWECSPGTRARIEEDGVDSVRSWWEHPSDARDPMYKDEDRRWWRCWEQKGHNEAVMAMAITPDRKHVFSVSADHLLCRYILDLDDVGGNRLMSKETKSIGNGCLAINSAGAVIAMGSWSGSIHLFSTASLKPLGRLDHHRESCQTIAFASAEGESKLMQEDDDDEAEDEDRHYWMASAGKDRRVALWSLADLR